MELPTHLWGAPVLSVLSMQQCQNVTSRSIINAAVSGCDIMQYYLCFSARLTSHNIIYAAVPECDITQYYLCSSARM